MLVLVALLSGACQEASSLPGPQPATGGQGSAGQPGAAGSGTTIPQEFAPAGGSFKRLTTSEYQASLRDLLGEVTIGDLEPDTFIDGFAKIGSAQLAFSLNGVEKYELAADAATRQVFGDAARRSAFVAVVRAAMRTPLASTASWAGSGGSRSAAR
jgi:hypothetical protein